MIHNVGYSIGTLIAIGIKMVGKRQGVLLVGKHQLVYSIGTSRGVLQQVGSVVPSTTHINALPLLGGVVAHIGIFSVTTVVLEWIIATLLLAHIVEHKVGSAVIHRTIDGKDGRRGFSHSYEIGALALKITEIQPARILMV